MDPGDICPPQVEAHNILVEPMLTPLRVNSVEGKIQADKMCPNIRIEIRGIEFPANLVVMGTQGINVILWMNWLHKNQSIVSCDKEDNEVSVPNRGRDSDQTDHASTRGRGLSPNVRGW